MNYSRCETCTGTGRMHRHTCSDCNGQGGHIWRDPHKNVGGGIVVGLLISLVLFVGSWLAALR